MKKLLTITEPSAHVDKVLTVCHYHDDFCSVGIDATFPCVVSMSVPGIDLTNDDEVDAFLSADTTIDKSPSSTEIHQLFRIDKWFNGFYCRNHHALCEGWSL